MKNMLPILVIAVLFGIGSVFLYNSNNAKKIVQSPSPSGYAKENNADEQKILGEKIKHLLEVKYKKEVTRINVLVENIDGVYAKGEVWSTGGGGIWFAAKKDGEWDLIWDGNGIIKCSDLALYPDFSHNLIPKCFDGATDTLVDR